MNIFISSGYYFLDIDERCMKDYLMFFFLISCLAYNQPLFLLILCHGTVPTYLIAILFFFIAFLDLFLDPVNLEVYSLSLMLK